MTMLHMPSYELGKLLARWDDALGVAPRDSNALLAAAVTLPEHVEGFTTKGGMPLFPSSVLEGYADKTRQLREQASRCRCGGTIVDGMCNTGAALQGVTL